MPVGRHRTMTGSFVKQKALAGGLTVAQPEKLTKEFIEELRAMKPEFFVVAGYGKIFPKSLLEIPSIGSYNIHLSLLPKYRGASPVQEALLHGDTITGNTIIKMTEAMDAGPMVWAEEVEITPEDTMVTVNEKLARSAARNIVEVLIRIAKGEVTELAQDEKEATFCHKICKEDGSVEWSIVSAHEVVNQIRAFTPWPSCFTYWNGKLLKLLSATISNTTTDIKPAEMVIENNQLLIGTAKGALMPQQLQLEGKSPTSVRDFINGNAAMIKAHPLLTE